MSLLIVSVSRDLAIFCHLGNIQYQWITQGGGNVLHTYSEMELLRCKSTNSLILLWGGGIVIMSNLNVMTVGERIMPI